MTAVDQELKARIKKGYDYFWSLKPSQVTPQDVMYLHGWLNLLNRVKLDNPDTTRRLDESEMYEVAKLIFS